MPRIIPILFLLQVTLGIAKNPTIDSLQLSLQENVSPDLKIKTYRALSKEYYQSQRHYDSSYYYSKLGFDIAIEHELILEQAQLLFDQAAIYRAVGDLDKALYVYNTSLLKAKSLGYENKKTQRLITATINNMGDLHVQKEEYMDAETYFKEALVLAKKYGYKDIEAIEYINLSEIEFFKGNFENSKVSIQKAIPTHKEFVNQLPSYYYILARTNFALHSIDSAEAQAVKGLQMAEKENHFAPAKDLTLLLAKIYNKKSNYSDANKYTELALTYNDSINRYLNRTKIEKLLLNYQLKEQETTLEYLAQKNKYQTLLYIFTGIGLLLLIVIVLRQLKIVRMTKSIHDIQNDLIKSELELRKQSSISSFQATIDTEDPM